jgi:hypothetical protein
MINAAVHSKKIHQNLHAWCSVNTHKNKNRMHVCVVQLIAHSVEGREL